MKDRKKHFLKDAVVVLIAVFMVTTVLPTALADTGNIEDKASQPIYTLRSEGIHILNIPEGTIMGSAEIDPEGSLAGTLSDYYIQYHDDYTENGLGLTSGGTISTGVQFQDDKLGPYRGMTIDAVIQSMGCDDYGAEPGVAYTVWASAGAQPADPTALPPLASGTSDNDIWETIDITDFVIPASGDLWMGVIFTHSAGQYPMGFDTNNVDTRGGYLWYSGSWDTLGNIGYPGVWGFTAGIITGGEPPEPEKEDCIPDACDFAIKGFTDEFMAQAKGVDVNGDKKIDYYIWNSLPKDICIKIANKGEIGIGELKLLADLYKKVCGPTVTIFKQPKYDLTQFPCCGDNYPFYFPDSNGWYIQDDTDGDSWVLQGGADNRWYDENQAWRCTKGEDRTYGADEDVYLGLSDTAPPNTYDNLTTPWFDIAGVACATVTFYQWCEGEYVIDEDGNVIPVDYGTIAYSLDNGTTWNEIPMDDFLAYDTQDQWVKVTLKFMNSAIDDNDLAYMHAYNIICDDCEPQEGDIVIDANLTLATLKVRFIWHKDPCLQFEGWYIDALEVKVTLDYELEIACQTHEVIELPPCDPEVGVVWTDYCFPLPCDVEKDTWYELHIYAQVYDPMGCEFDLLNNEFKYQFKVADIHDIACIEILPDDPQYVQPGDMVNINVTVQNIGTYAEDNVPVDIKVGDVITTYQLEDHFESSPSGYSVWYFTYGTGTLTPYTWSKGWTQISNIYDNAPASARSMLPGNECLLFAENLGGMPTLPEDTCMMFMAPETVILDPNHNGIQDCGENIGAKMTFAAKYSMDINLDGEIGSAVSLAWMPEEGPWVGYFAWTALTESDSDGYENDWQAYNLDLYEEAKKVFVGESSAFNMDYIPEFSIGFLVRSAGPITNEYISWVEGTADGGCANAFNPVPWTGFALDNWKIMSTDYDSASMTTYTTLFTGELQPGQKETLYTSWPATLCTHAVIADVQLPGDVDTTNDACCAVIVNGMNKATCFEYKLEDLTGGGDCLWHVCCNRETADDCFAWAGVETGNSAQYVNNMDDYLVSPTINLCAYVTAGVAVNWTSWWKFANKFDFGELQMKRSFDHDLDPATANITSWYRIWKTEETSSGGVFVPCTAYVPEAWLNSSCITQFRFRMYSDDAGVDEGFYIDDVQIVDVEAAEPMAAAGTYIQYHDDYTENGLGLTAGGTLSEGVQFQDDKLGPYRGMSITDVLVSIGCDDYGPEPGVAWSIWAADGAQPSNPTTLPVLASGTSGSDVWNTIPIIEHTIPASGDMWIGIVLTHAAGQYPMGFDTDNTDTRGGWLYYSGSWTTLGAVGYPGVWGISAGIGGGGGGGNWNITDWGDPIPNIFQGGDGTTETFEDQDIAPWTCEAAEGGQHWFSTDDPATIPSGAAPIPEETCEECTHGWYAIPSANLLPYGYNQWQTINNAIAFKLDLTDPLLNPNFIIFSCMMNYNLSEESIYIEISPDWDGIAPMESATWITYWAHTKGDGYGDNTKGWMSLEDLTGLVDPFAGERWNLDEYAGETVWIRFRLVAAGNGASIGEGWAIDDLKLEFKLTGTVFTDTQAPLTSIYFNEDTATVTLIAVDLPLDKGVGVDATYYKIDGGATQTYGGPFTISEGSHTVEYWSVDNNDNEESHKSATLLVDTTPPVVTITSPKEGYLYLFGSPIMKRILSEKTLCIGKVPVEATATDASGIMTVLFKYDGETHWDNVAPYTDTYREMHFGPMTISVSAIDNNGLESAPVTMDVVVYCIGLF